MSRTPASPAASWFLATLSILLVATCCPLGGCSDEKSPEAPTVENFARSWRLSSCSYRQETNGAVRVDLVAEGWVIGLHVNDNGRFRYAWTPPGGVEAFWDGGWTVDGAVVRLTRDGNGFAWEFTAEVRETSMTLLGAHAEYDIDDDGTPEPAIWDLAGATD